MVTPFPSLKLDPFKNRDDKNPAIQAFGHRFFTDQTINELLVELLLVFNSPKKIGSTEVEELIPNLNTLDTWPQNEHLKYAPKAKLLLKLFSFLGTSKLETRHEIHKAKYNALLDSLKGNIDSFEAEDHLRVIEDLLLGFQGEGVNRTWCARSFLPICKGFLAYETIWKKTNALKESGLSWESSLENFSNYYYISMHRFLARGGEVLYLQLCNLLCQDSIDIKKWIKENKLSVNYIDKANLHKELSNAIGNLYDSRYLGLEKLINFIENEDDDTVKQTDFNTDGNLRYVSCGWCPVESWRETLFFATELIRVCQVSLDQMEKLDMLSICCSFQVLRSLCARASESILDKTRYSLGNPLGYVLVLSATQDANMGMKLLSQENVKAIDKLLWSAIRTEEINKTFADGSGLSISAMKSAERSYGRKVFMSLSKRLGLIVPRKGPGARFVLNDRLLRYLIITIIPAGKRYTLDTFKKLLFQHYGFVVDGEYSERAREWLNKKRLSCSDKDQGMWFENMLYAGGFLIKLSDGCSMVENPFGKNMKEGE